MPMILLGFGEFYFLVDTLGLEIFYLSTTLIIAISIIIITKDLQIMGGKFGAPKEAILTRGRSIAVFESVGGHDNEEDGHRKDTMPIVQSINKMGWYAEVVKFEIEKSK